MDGGDRIRGNGRGSDPIKDPAVWTSQDDGRTWQRAHTDAFGTLLPRLVVATPWGLYAFAGTPDDNPAEPLAVLHSDTGTAWSLLTTQAPQLSEVVSGGPNLVGHGIIGLVQ